MSDPEPEQRPSIPGVITTAITVAGFAFLYLSQAPQLPILERVLFGGIVAVSILLFIVWIWSRPLRAWYEGWTRNRIARRNFPELVGLLERFRQFVDSGISQPHFFLYQLKGRGKDFDTMPLPSYPYYCQQFAGNLSYGLKSWKSNFVSFKWLADSLSTLILYYNETYLSSPVKEVLGIIKRTIETETPPDAPQVPEDLRKGFNSARVRWVRFLQDFEGFTYRVSKELGQYQVKIENEWQDIDYLNTYRFEPPEELPAPMEF